MHAKVLGQEDLTTCKAGEAGASEETESPPYQVRGDFEQ